MQGCRGGHTSLVLLLVAAAHALVDCFFLLVPISFVSFLSLYTMYYIYYKYYRCCSPPSLPLLLSYVLLMIQLLQMISRRRRRRPIQCDERCNNVGVTTLPLFIDCDGGLPLPLVVACGCCPFLSVLVVVAAHALADCFLSLILLSSVFFLSLYSMYYI